MMRTMRSVRSDPYHLANGAAAAIESHSRRVINTRNNKRSSICDQQSCSTLDLRIAREIELFQGRRVRNRRIEGADDADRCIEGFEGFLLDDGGEAFADAACARILVDDQHLMATARERQDSGTIQRHERSQIEHARFDAVLREPL